MRYTRNTTRRTEDSVKVVGVEKDTRDPNVRHVYCLMPDSGRYEQIGSVKSTRVSDRPRAANLWIIIGDQSVYYPILIDAVHELTRRVGVDSEHVQRV